MTLADIPSGMRLKEIAGWNQTQDDWDRFFRAEPQGCFLAEWDGQVAGTVATIVYEQRFAWVSMVLVDPTFRGKGIGTALLVQALEYLDAKRVPCVKLDATPQGKPLYTRLGFRIEYELERHRLRRAPDAIAAEPLRVPNLPVIDSDALFQLDREVFGADRSELLRSMATVAPELPSVVCSDGGVDAYILGRNGSLADHLGPWVAVNAGAAREVFENSLARSRRELVFVDVVRDNPWATALLAEKGFQFSRPLTRMYRGENAHPGRPELLGAIVGPEFG